MMSVNVYDYENVIVFPFKSNIECRSRIQGTFPDENTESFYVYQIECGDVSYLGMIASINVQSTIKFHEKVLPEKVERYVQRLQLTGTQANPVMLIHRHDALQAILKSVVKARDEDARYCLPGQVHKIWKVTEPDLICSIQRQCQLIEEFYIGDGHHRVAALQHQDSLPNREKPKPYRLLGALFAHTEVSIDAFNRGCFDLNGLSAEQFLERLSETFAIKPVPEVYEPSNYSEFGMFLQGKWYQLTLANGIPEAFRNTRNTAVELLEALIFAEHLGITDTRHSQRVAFIDGSKKRQSFEAYCHDNDIEVAFTFKAISPSELMQKIDDCQTLPPHSTWFSPRLLPDMLHLNIDIQRSKASDVPLLDSAVDVVRQPCKRLQKDACTFL